MSAAVHLALSDVPETMLWTLYGRAREAMRDDTALPDPEAVRIYQSIDYDFRRSFGPANPLLAMRAKAFDESLKRHLQRCPGSSVVNLGEGLETQRFRVGAPGSQWLSVDLPAAMRVRERFIPASDSCRHLAVSATETSQWFPAVSRDEPVFLSAQGLLMYLPPAKVQRLLQDIADYFPRFRMVFDVIPGWVARASRLQNGLPLTPYYRTPPMPWGVSRYAIQPRLRRWLGTEVVIEAQDYPAFPRGLLRRASQLAPRLPGARLWMPTIVELGSAG